MNKEIVPEEISVSETNNKISFGFDKIFNCVDTGEEIGVDITVAINKDNKIDPYTIEDSLLNFIVENKINHLNILAYSGKLRNALKETLTVSELNLEIKFYDIV